ncbi:MAG: thioredoxin family protein [Phycisphaerales bacterium]|nr:thioredoxin family protein [Phycisphaerales bacterium]MCI0629513.1 thioredoxin family protein [Phycisphaerales bacterium]
MQNHTWTLHSPVLRLAFLLLMVVAVGFSMALAQSESKPSGTPKPTAAAAEQAPKVIAIKFHADWCGFCKQMGGVFEEMQAKFDQEPVLYVTFDQTRDFNRTQSRYLAYTMGLDSVWTEHGGKTGFVLLIDPKTHAVIQKLTHEQNLKQMGAALQEAVKAAS